MNHALRARSIPVPAGNRRTGLFLPQVPNYVKSDDRMELNAGPSVSGVPSTGSGDGFSGNFFKESRASTCTALGPILAKASISAGLDRQGGLVRRRRLQAPESPPVRRPRWLISVSDGRWPRWIVWVRSAGESISFNHGAASRSPRRPRAAAALYWTARSSSSWTRLRSAARPYSRRNIPERKHARGADLRLVRAAAAARARTAPDRRTTRPRDRPAGRG